MVDPPFDKRRELPKSARAAVFAEKKVHKVVRAEQRSTASVPMQLGSIRAAMATSAPAGRMLLTSGPLTSSGLHILWVLRFTAGFA